VPLLPDFPTDDDTSAELRMFDRTIARVSLAGELVGYVSFRLHWMATQTHGFLWWRKFGAPYRVVEWMEVFVRDGRIGYVDDGLLAGDGIADLRHEVERGAWTTPPWKLEHPDADDAGTSHPASWPDDVELTLELLTGPDAEAAWTEFGWGKP